MQPPTLINQSTHARVNEERKEGSKGGFRGWMKERERGYRGGCYQ